jgi:hypothetical protein
MFYFYGGYSMKAIDCLLPICRFVSRVLVSGCFLMGFFYTIHAAYQQLNTGTGALYSIWSDRNKNNKCEYICISSESIDQKNIVEKFLDCQSLAICVTRMPKNMLDRSLLERLVELLKKLPLLQKVKISFSLNSEWEDPFTFGGCGLRHSKDASVLKFLIFFLEAKPSIKGLTIEFYDYFAINDYLNDFEHLAQLIGKQSFSELTMSFNECGLGGFTVDKLIANIGQLKNAQITTSINEDSTNFIDAQILEKIIQTQNTYSKTNNNVFTLQWRLPKMYNDNQPTVCTVTSIAEKEQSSTKSQSMEKQKQEGPWSFIPFNKFKQEGPTTLNFLWINLKKTKYFAEYRGQEHTKGCIESICHWLNQKQIKLNFWYDPEMIENHKQVCEEFFDAIIQCIGKEKVQNLTLCSIRDLPLVQGNVDVFSDKIPCYFRVDLLKLIIAFEELMSNKTMCFILGDIDIKHFDLQSVINNDDVLYFLNYYGIVMGRKSGLGFENGFQIIIKDSDCLQAIKEMLIDKAIQKARQHLGQANNQNYKEKLEPDYVFLIFKNMFKYLYVLKQIVQLKDNQTQKILASKQEAKEAILLEHPFDIITDQKIQQQNVFSAALIGKIYNDFYPTVYLPNNFDFQAQSNYY